MEETMGLVLRVDIAEVSGELRFVSSETKRGRQEGLLKIHHDATGPSVSIKPMSSPDLEQLMSTMVYEKVLSDESRDAIIEFAEGFFRAGIEYANRKKD